MQYLVTLCNITDGDPLLLKFSADEGFAAVPVPEIAGPPLRGATGCTVFHDRLVVGLQRYPATLLVTDRRLQRMHFVSLDHAQDIHGMISVGDELLLSSTGTNQILRYDADFRFRGVFGLDDGALLDRDHINDLCMVEERILALRFGPRRRDGLRNGALYDPKSGNVEYEGLNEPHSIADFDGSLFVLDSGTGSLFRFTAGVAPRRELSVIGYARGLSIDDRWICIGRSAYRSRGRVNYFQHSGRLAGTEEGAAEVQQAGIFMIDRTSEASSFFPLGAMGNEIYNIVPLTEHL